MNNLPTELVQSIVKCVDHGDLHACSLVNREFHAFANPILWYKLILRTDSRFTKLMNGLNAASATSKSGSLSSPLAPHIRHVHLSSFLTDAQLLTLMKHARLMNNLIMEDAINITDESVQQLPRHCPNLKYLYLCGSAAVTQRSIQAIGDLCYQLTQLKFISYPGLTCNSFHALATCPLEIMVVSGRNLKDFDDEDENEIDDDGDTMMMLMGRTMNEAVLDLVRFQHLIHLEIFHCPSTFSYRLITTLNTTTPIIWPQLETLTLDGCWILTEHQAITLMHAHPDLTMIGLEENKFEDTFLEAMASSLLKLEYVYLSYCHQLTAYGVRQLVKRCPMLKEVSLYGCGMTKNDFPEAGEYCLDSDNENDENYVDLLDEDTIYEIQQLDSSDDDDSNKSGDNEGGDEGGD